MYIARILCPILSLGPGKRLVIWTKGCSKNCPDCISPEMASFDESCYVPVEDIYGIVEKIYNSEGFDGVTISGGDPFEQLDELLLLLKKIRKFTNDILVYTGYIWSDFEEKIDSATKCGLIKNIGVLIDGPYIKEQNFDNLTLRGSANQNIIFFDQKLKKQYEIYLKQGRLLQNIYMGEDLCIIGIMNK